MSDDDAKKPCTHGDEIMILPSPAGPMALRHLPGCAVEAFPARFAREGEPLEPGTEALHVEAAGSGRYHVRDTTKIPGPARAVSSGPAQVATEAYREGWGRVFGGRVAVGEA